MRCVRARVRRVDADVVGGEETEMVEKRTRCVVVMAVEGGGGRGERDERGCCERVQASRSCE